MTRFEGALRIGGTGGARRLDVVLAIYVLHAVLALAVAWPLAKLLADPVMAYPRGDRTLFDPGGLYLTEALRLGRGALTRAAEGMSFGVLVALYLGLLPLAALLRALGTTERLTLPTLAAYAVRSFGPLSLLLGVALVATGLACAVPLVAASLLETKFAALFGDRGGDLATGALYALAFVVAATIGVVHDMARVAVVTRALPAMQAVRVALDAFRVSIAEAFGGFALRGLVVWLLITLVAKATTLLGVETSGPFAATLLLHQAVAFAMIFLRADWLGLATELVVGFRLEQPPSSYTSDR